MQQLNTILKYRQNDYFNKYDYFLIYDLGLKSYKLTQMFLSGGAYYTIDGLKYKGTSVPSINFNELKGFKIHYKETNLKGFISKAISGNIGIVWNQGQWYEFKNIGFPNYWNEPKNITLE